MKYIFRSITLILCFACDTQIMTQYDTFVSRNVPEITWGTIASINQLVAESVDPVTCPSGWTTLFEQLNQKGEGHSVSLQKEYVRRFATLDDFTKTTYIAHTLLDPWFRTLRISLSWPCFANPVWKRNIQQTVRTLIQAGYTLELVLSHHDSYPARLYETRDSKSTTTSGWAHEDAADSFISYVRECIFIFKDILPKNTRVYLINEPIAMLYNSYLGNGNWPPGGKQSIKGFYRAMINLRSALRTSAQEIYTAGWEPAIAKNIRPITDNGVADSHLDYTFNWWLLTSVVGRCNDETFTRFCDGLFEESPPITIGITYYGTMEAHDTITESGILEDQVITVPLPNMDFTPNGAAFARAIKETIARYPNNRITIAEIGLSSGDQDKALNWLASYTQAVQEIEHKSFEKHIVLHTIFESAEFSSGEWFFHILEGCEPGQVCQFTHWGETLLQHIAIQ